MRNQLVVVGWLITVTLFGLGGMAPAEAGIPRELAFQGRLTDPTGQPLEGTHALTFRLFPALVGGAALWQETQTLTLSGGLFSTRLGSQIPLTLPFDQSYYVEIEIGGDILAPRQPLTASAYALTATRLEGVALASEGRLGIGTTSPGAKLHVEGTTMALGIGSTALPTTHANHKFLFLGSNAIGSINAAAAELQTSANSYIDTPGSRRYTTTNPATLYTQTAGTHEFDVASPGTAGAAITFTPALFIKNNGHVGIGTTSPRAKLEVVGTGTPGLKIYDSAISGASYGKSWLYQDGSTLYLKGVYANEGGTGSVASFSPFDITLDQRTTITGSYLAVTGAGPHYFQNGDVGIGTTRPSYKLHTYSSTAGAGNILYIQHADDTHGASDATVQMAVGGNSGGDPKAVFTVPGQISYGFGIDNSDGNKLKLSANAELSRNTALTIDNAGNVGLGTPTPTQKLDVQGAVRLAPTGAPSNPSAGTLYFDAATKHFYGFDGTTWKPLDN
ncbi:MAG: hypothetical protein HY600_05705 [Candidatus Omnitrophica bacterium]|nr:hypothetical protein [Candidatus Omnitrophota bacterium]